jgi:hypothetical protein
LVIWDALLTASGAGNLLNSLVDERLEAALFRSRASLHLENLALRHQVALYKETVHRPWLRLTDRVFWA